MCFKTAKNEKINGKSAENFDCFENRLKTFLMTKINNFYIYLDSTYPNLKAIPPYM